jgi:hypothetical protein
VSSPEDRSFTWENDPQTRDSGAKGAREIDQTAPILDPLDAPLPSERARVERERLRREGRTPAESGATRPADTGYRPRTSRTTDPVDTPAETTYGAPPGAERATERTDVVPRRSLRPADDDDIITPRRRPSPGRLRGAPRRVKRTLKHIDPVSVLKVSFFFYGIFLVVWLFVVAILYWFIRSLGFFDLVNGVGEGMQLWDEVTVTLWLVEKWAFFIGVIMVIIGAIANLVLAFLYNVASDVVGGVQMTFVERDN